MENMGLKSMLWAPDPFQKITKSTTASATGVRKMDISSMAQRHSPASILKSDTGDDSRWNPRSTPRGVGLGLAEGGEEHGLELGDLGGVGHRLCTSASNFC